MERFSTIYDRHTLHPDLGVDQRNSDDVETRGADALFDARITFFHPDLAHE